MPGAAVTVPVTVPVPLPLSVKVSPAGNPVAESVSGFGWGSLAETEQAEGPVVGHGLVAGHRQAGRHVLDAEDGPLSWARLGVLAVPSVKVTQPVLAL